jgi:hypothetical protein
LPDKTGEMGDPGFCAVTSQASFFFHTKEK